MIDRASQQTTEILREIFVIAKDTELVMAHLGDFFTVDFPATWKNFIKALGNRIIERESQAEFERSMFQQAGR